MVDTKQPKGYQSRDLGLGVVTFTPGSLATRLRAVRVRRSEIASQLKELEDEQRTLNYRRAAPLDRRPLDSSSP